MVRQVSPENKSKVLYYPTEKGGDPVLLHLAGWSEKHPPPCAPEKEVIVKQCRNLENVSDMVYKDMQSPVGVIRLVASDKGLAAILWEGEDYKRTKLPTPERDDKAPILMQTEQQLKEYFDKMRTVFDVPLDLTGTPFQVKVWEALCGIPFGITRTYGELARLLGDIKAVRAVGGALNKNPISIIVPCHRVVGASGKLVGFAGGLKNKSILLELEKPLLF